MGDMTTNFNRAEFSCKCGCGKNNIKDNLVIQLQVARDSASDNAGTPITFNINCGTRCLAHNIEVEGVPDSSHLGGWAADISCQNSSGRFYMIEALLKVGFKRIGVYANFIHVDCDPDKPVNVVWYGKL